MNKNFKVALLSIAFALTLIITGCSSTETSNPPAAVDSVESSSPAAMEDRVYQKSVEEKEETEKLKKQKSNDDDMERLD